MNDKFKPVSDALRKALLALGETPEQHQKEQLLKSTTTKALSTEKLIGLRELNRRAMQRRKMTGQERMDEALRLESAAARTRPEVPDAYVLFARDITCTACSQAWTQLDYATPFLRLRRVFPSGKLDISSARYVPAGTHPIPAGAKLPSIIEHTRSEVLRCLNCFSAHAVHFLSEMSTESQPIQVVQTPSESGSLENESKSSPQISGSGSMEQGAPSGTLASHVEFELVGPRDISNSSSGMGLRSDSDESTPPPPVLASG